MEAFSRTILPLPTFLWQQSQIQGLSSFIQTMCMFDSALRIAVPEKAPWNPCELRRPKEICTDILIQRKLDTHSSHCYIAFPTSSWTRVVNSLIMAQSRSLELSSAISWIYPFGIIIFV